MSEPILTGRLSAPALLRRLRAGPVTCLLDGIELRDIRRGSLELANLLYVAVRDDRWNTLPAVIEDLQVTQGTDTFQVSFRARHHAADLDLTWDGRMTGSADGTIGVVMDGAAASVFRYNRIGWNLLHSVQTMAGRPYRTWGGDDGLEHTGSFPEAIAPQGARDGRLTGMLEPFRHMWIDVGSGTTLTIDADGDEFETEDQRNFADATFKTYGTPLQRPAPRMATIATRIAQSITLSSTGPTVAGPVAGSGTATMSAAGNPDPDLIRVVVGAPGQLPMPPIGLGVASDGQALQGRDVERIRALAPGHLWLTLDPTTADAVDRFASAVSDARAVGATLFMELLIGPGGAGIDAVPALVDGGRDTLSWVFVRAPGDGPIDYGTPSEIVQTARARLSAVIADVPVGCMVGSLAPLIREPRDPTSLGSLGLPMCPTVHRDDDRTVMENLVGLEEQVARAIDAMGGMPVHVGPVTLATIHGPWPGGSASLGLSPQVDPRQPSLFAAVWTVGALSRLLGSGAASLTLFETAGWRGVLERASGFAAPGRFLSRPDSVFPVWHVLADLAQHRVGTLRPIEVADGSRVAALAVTSDRGLLVLVANLTRDTIAIDVVLPADADQALSVRILDAAAAIDAMDQPEVFRAHGTAAPSATGAASATPVRLTLAAYAVASVESVPEDLRR